LIKSVRFNVVLIHIFCWLIFILYELTVLYFDQGKLENVKVYCSYYGLNITYFYCFIKVLNIAFNSNSKKYLKAFFTLFWLILIYFCVRFYIGFLFQDPHLDIKAHFHYFVKNFPISTFRFGYFTILATFYWAAGHISSYRQRAAASEKQELIALKENAELETRLAESRNAYLKQQVNPHLLFNALNFIYSSVYPYSADASKCVLLLSDIMRFSLEETGADGKVPLDREVEQLHNLVEINRYRYETQLAICIEFAGKFEKFRIIPLILLTLTENLFKHGNLTEPGDPALLRLSVSAEGLLSFYCKNLKKSKSDYARSQQLGLQNVRVRLDFAYPGQYEMTVTETEKHFELCLNLHL